MSLITPSTELNITTATNYAIGMVNETVLSMNRSLSNEDLTVTGVNISDKNQTMPNAISPDPASQETIILLSLLFCIIGTAGLIGNSLVIIVILFDRKMRQSVTNIFIMNLAAADFIIMFVGVPEIVQFMMNRGWLLGPTMCKVNRFVLVVCLYVSILSLVSVCVER